MSPLCARLHHTYLQTFSFNLTPTLSIEMRRARALSSKLLCGMALVLCSRNMSFTNAVRPFSGWQSLCQPSTLGQPNHRPMVEGVERSTKKPLAIQLGAETNYPKSTTCDNERMWYRSCWLWCIIVALLSCSASAVYAGRFVVWSALLGFLLVFMLMAGQGFNLPVELSRMAHFACRGATLAQPLSLLVFLPAMLTTLLASPVLTVVLAKTGAIGGVEELGKFLSLIWLSWSTTKPWVAKRPPAESWPRNKKAIMLASFSTGVGFMVAENCQFFSNAFIWLLKTRHLRVWGDDSRFLDNVGSNLVFKLCVHRLLLNPHPWLSGIVAGRFADIGSKGPLLTWQTLWRVLWPSIALHALMNLNSAFLWHRFFTFLLCIGVFGMTWDRSDKEQSN